MNRGTLWLGLMLVALGVIFLLDQFGVVVGAALLAAWWPVAIIALGLLAFTAGASTGAVLVTVLGLMLLVGTLGIIAVTFSLVWPLLIVVLGIGLLSGGFGSFRRPGPGDEAVDQFALFSGYEIRSVARHFRGGSLMALFGGFTLDLHEAQLAENGAHLQVTALFGGGTILVPPGWRITMSGLPIFGGFSDKTGQAGPLPPSAPHLHVDVLCMFGGVEVKLHEAAQRPFQAAA